MPPSSGTVDNRVGLAVVDGATGGLQRTAFEPPARTAYLGQNERFRQPGRFGNLSAVQLTAILQQLERGEVSEWCDLVQFALKTDDLLISLYETRLNRVAQASYQIVPNEFGNPHLAQLAAEFVNELLARVENWDQFLKNMLHAIALGFSASEIEWDYDGLHRVYYARNIHRVNPNRFRYDEQWKLRLYDHGSRAHYPHGQYGEVLRQGGWVVHHHYAVSGDPCDAGIMRMSIWRWLFRRWADTFWIQNLEKYGAPWVMAKVAPGTPDPVRRKIQEALQNMTIERAAIVETGGELVVTPPPMGSGTESQHQMYMDFGARSLTTTWLGASDITQPGMNGSQAAVDTRVGATTDPRMITDGQAVGMTLQSQLIRWLLHFNLHKFGRIPPTPKFVFKSASDEVETDTQALVEQNVAERNLGKSPALEPNIYEVRGDDSAPGLESAMALPSSTTSTPNSSNSPPTLEASPSGTVTASVPASPVDVTPEVPLSGDVVLSGPQVKSLLEVLRSVVEGQLPRESAVVIIEVAFALPRETAERMLGAVGQTFVRAEPPSAALPEPLIIEAEPPVEATDPKAPGRPVQGRRTRKRKPPSNQLSMSATRATTRSRSSAKTSQTGSRSIGPLETVLRSMSAGRRR